MSAINFKTRGILEIQSNLPDKEFKETVIRMLTQLERGIQELRENFNEELESIKKNQAEDRAYNI